MSWLGERTWWSFFSSDQGRESLNIQDGDGDTLLHYAVKHHSLELCQFFQEQGALWLTNKQGQTPFHYISQRQSFGPENVELASFLLNSTQGRCLNTQDHQGNSALHYAAQYNHQGLCDTLLNHGALMQKNHQGKMPSDVAIQEGWLELGIFLEQAHIKNSLNIIPKPKSGIRL